jgi:death-on-curing protein
VTLAPGFLSLEDVLEIHAQQLAEYGGSPGVRSMALLESAVMTPQASFDGEYVHKDVFEMAAAYAFHIAENQPLVDGNKRTGLAAALVFLWDNGLQAPDPQGLLYQAMIDVSARRMDKAGLAELLRGLAVPVLGEEA